MKSTILFLVSVLVFLFTAPSFSTSILEVDDDLVLDIYGDPLEKDVGYSLSLPGYGAASGKVMLTPPTVENNETCEANVVLVRPSLVLNGTPFTFTPVKDEDEGIKLRSGLAIQSPTKNPCGGSNSTIWKISNREGLFNSIITTGGLFDNMQSCFRIIKTQSLFPLYSFQYCRGVCGPTREAKMCWLVGTTRTESGEHLSVGGSPLLFQFIRNTGFTAM